LQYAEEIVTGGRDSWVLVFGGGRESFGFKVFNQDVANAPSLEVSVRFHAFPRRSLPPTALPTAPKAAQTIEND
jgi:hypothetical protein